jgi:hypothetical protein
MDDVRTLLRDSGLSHFYWAEAAAYSIDTRNIIPSRRHPRCIPLEVFSGTRQNVAHLRTFGSKCWAKVPTTHGIQVMGGSKLDPHSVECRLLGYASGNGNYKVQDVATHRVFVSRDVVFEEGRPHRTSASVGEQIPLFDTSTVNDGTPLANNDPDSEPNIAINDDSGARVVDRTDQPINTPTSIASEEPRRSTRMPQPSQARIQSTEYQQREVTERRGGQEWASSAIDWSPIDDKNFTACLAETKALHHIPRSYKHAMATDPERWMVPMCVEMETLKAKHTWDLVMPPPGVNVMDSMWIYDIKWDGEGNRIKDKA